jgi:EAL domain-containing protein (putative c-di-GMP-specific phosphodiesterase class I)/GGDEF domain-containing protein
MTPLPTQTVNLLVMTSEASEAEQLIKSLHDGGLPVRGIYTAQADRMKELMAARTCELILCCGYDPKIDVDAVLSHYRELVADVPLIVIAEQTSEQQTMNRSMRGGARDVTRRGDTERLRLIIGRELSDLRSRRRLRQLAQRLQQCERLGQEQMASIPEENATVPQSEPPGDTLPCLSGVEALIAAINTLIGPERQVTQPVAIFYIRVRTAANLFRDFGLTRGLAVIDGLGTALNALCSEQYQLVRISDDGFGLLAPGVDEAGADSLAERIRGQIRLRPGATGRDRLEGDCEVGYVVVTGLSPSPSSLLDAAYRACHGGNTAPQVPTSLAAREKQSAKDGDNLMTNVIQSALENDRLMLVYQPIISLMGDNEENYSVLVRLFDDSDNLIEAKDFIGVAIRSGMIVHIDKWAIRHAFKVMSEHRSTEREFHFFINLAEDSFRDPTVMIWILDCLRQFELSGDRFTFVIQEELVEGNLSNLNRVVDALRKTRCRIAVNHFGASQNPEMLLQGLPLDFVMLLPMFAQGLADDANKQQRLVSLAKLAREFNVKTVVTGVEDARSLTILWTAGVDYVQGNFLQRPSPSLDTVT